MKREKFQLDFVLNRVSLSILWNAISTSNGLSDWFADKVEVKDKIFTFYWKGHEQIAEVLNSRIGNHIRFRWEEDKDTEYYFEFKMAIDEITNQVSLSIIDFAEPDEIDDAKALWTKQIKDLTRTIGA